MLVDLSAAVEAAAIELARQAGYRWDERPAVWDSLEYFHASYRNAARRVVQAVLPPLEREVRGQLARELISFAETFGRDNAAQCTLRRHIHMCASRIGPGMTDQEVVEALRRGDFVGCHLDNAGRAIPPGERSGS